MFVALSVSLSACDVGVDVPNQHFVGGSIQYFKGDTDGDGVLTDDYAYDENGLKDFDCADEGTGYKVFTLPERGQLDVECNPKLYVYAEFVRGTVNLIRN